METQIVTAWEIGFCINFMVQGRRERTWQLFRWNVRISRIN